MKENKFSKINPRMTMEQYKLAVESHRIRTETPSLSDLARMWNLPPSTVAFSVKRGIKRYDVAIWRAQNESLGAQKAESTGEAHE